MEHRILLTRFGMLLVVGWFLAAEEVQAQEKDPVAGDSLRSYELAEIVVESPDRQTKQTAATVHHVALAGIARTDAASIDRVARLIPAAHVQTNSRGETLLYLRNAGERQVALFFDGASLNVPWDNRFNMSLVPAGVVGGITVAKGVPSVLYGTNVLGGAINMTSRTLTNDGTFTQVEGTAGTFGAVQGRLMHLGRVNRFSYAVSAGYTEQDGMGLPEGIDLPFSQDDEVLRTNTDYRLLSLFGRAAYTFDGGAQFGLSLLHLDGAQGVAPESHLDPEQYNVRYWRYPDWRNTMAVLNGQVPVGARGGMIRSALWATHFAQQISQYASETYDVLLEDQEDADNTAGARVTFQQPAGPGELRLALSALASRHEQQNIAYEDGAPVSSVDPAAIYSQYVWSVGVEYVWRPPSPLEVLLGTSLDGISTPETGDKPPRDPQVDVGTTSGLRYRLDEAWTLRASVGRKVRFPTMRELFGEALGRFLVNPDLKAESSLLSEAGIGFQQPNAGGEVVAFFNRTFDAIDQRSVQLPGESRPRRQRVNLDGSRVAGVEVTGSARPVRNWSVSGHVTWTHVRGFEDGETVRLVEKPEWLGTLSVDYNAPGGFSTLFQTVYTGRAYGLNEDNAFQPLPTSLVFNIRLSYLFIKGNIATEIFARVNNATDEVTLPQLGLPGPGREFHMGLDVSF